MSLPLPKTGDASADDAPRLNVQYGVTCTAEDPQALARVMGVFAARALLPLKFVAERTVVGTVEIDIMIELHGGDGGGAQHIARVIERFPTVESVCLWVNGRIARFDHEAPHQTSPLPFL